MTKRIFLSFFLMAVAAGASFAQKIVVTKGQKLEAVTTTKMSMGVMGQTIDNESSATTSVEVKDVNADGFLFLNTLKRIITKVNGMGQDVNFDSDKKEDMEGEAGKVLKDRIGAVQEIRVDKKGKIADTKDNAEKPAAGGMADMMNMAGDLSKGQPYPYLIQLPEKKLKAGDSWTDSSGTTATVKMVTTYTLKGITNDGAVVSFSGTMAKSGTIEQNGMEMQMDITGVTKGESTYEPATGLLKTSATTADIKGTIGVMGQNAPITITVNANVVAKKI